MHLVIGAVGGVIIAVYVLIFVREDVLASYIQYEQVRTYAFGGFLTRLGVFAALGSFWVFLNDEKGRMKSFQFGLVAPYALAALVAANATKIELPDSTNSAKVNEVNQPQVSDQTGPLQAFWLGLIGRELNPPLTTEVANSAAPFPAPQDSSANDKIMALKAEIENTFKTSERRNFSDSLVSNYASFPSQQVIILKALFSAFQNDGYYEYRINLYILRTLGSLPKGWLSYDEENNFLNKLSELDADPLARDGTFKFWLNKARSTGQKK